MTVTQDTLAAIRERLELTDYGVAKRLGVTYSSMQRYRDGRGMDDDVALRAAALLELDEAGARRLVARLHAERAGTPETKAFWRRLAAAAVLAVACGVGLIGVDGNGALSFDSKGEKPILSTAYYVQCWRRRFVAWSQRFARIGWLITRMMTPCT